LLGVLKLDEKLGWYEGKRARGKLAYRVYVDAPAVMERVDTVVLRIERDLSKIRDAIADDLLDVYNESWRELRPRLSGASFKQRHELESLVVSKRRITLYFASGRLFGRRSVEVRLSPRLAVREVRISG
jgi:hypothetical protein